MKAWLFDAYPSPEGMTLWFIDEDGRPHRFHRAYHPAFYAAGPRSVLAQLEDALSGARIPVECSSAIRRELFSGAELPVLQVAVHAPLDFPAAVRRAAKVPGVSLFTCDLSTPQLFFYETELFPLGLYEITSEGELLRAAEPLSRVEDLEYELPPLTFFRMRLDGDPINPNHGWRSELEVSVAGDHVVLSAERPEDLIGSLNRLLRRYDPDLLLTEWGDSFVLPRLLRLAQQCGQPLALNRDTHARIRTRRERSFVTYGKTMYTARAHFLHGRWHLDLHNSFIYTESELAGLLEISRLSRLPVQYQGRTSIGTAISSMQLNRAVRDGILVPWHKSEPEAFKTAEELLITDKGGLTYQPIVGVFEGVGELDFSSMYPTMMAKFNISPETVNCKCCGGGEAVPEIGHTICKRRRGLVPQVLDHVLERRVYYKKRRQQTSGTDRAIYDQRQTALKWCLVCCFEGKTRVLYRYNNRWKIDPIRDIVEAYLPGDQFGEVPVEGLSVIGIDKNLRTVIKPMRSVIKTPAPSAMIHMRLRWGRGAVMTPNHRCYVLQDGRLQVKTADQLKVGDWIPMALSFEAVMGGGIGQIDLIQALKEKLPQDEQKRWRVFGRPIRRSVESHYKEFSRTARSEYCAKTIWNWREYAYLPLSHLQPEHFTENERARLQIGRGKLEGGLIQRMPARVEVDEDLGFLLGFFVGDGSYTGNMIRFDVGGNEYEHLVRLRRIVARKFEVSTRVYKERKASMYILQVNSVALIQIFKEIFGLEGSVDRGKLRIPEIILNGSFAAKRGFVLGLIGSDGSVSRVRNHADIASADLDFIRELGLLYASLGIDHRIGSRKKRLHVIQTRNLQEMKCVLGSGDFLSKKHEEVFHHRQSQQRQASRSPQFPVRVSALLRLSKQARVVRIPRISGIEMVSRSVAALKLKQLLVSRRLRARALIPKLNGLKQLVESSLIFASIVSVKQVPCSDPFVYCFSLRDEPTAFFIQGGILSSNSFGYLGYRNARYGRIEAHESTTAFSREMLLRAKELAESRGFRMLHALVDSVWLQKPGAGRNEYEALTQDIEKITNLPIFVEGVYRWIAYLPSKTHPGVGVPNRYLGVFDDGSTKIRGIEVRRGDTPVLVEEMQNRMLREMFQAATLDELRQRVPEVLRILEETLIRLRGSEVTPVELALTATISQEPGAYKNNHPIALAARALDRSGIRLHPGEAVQYIVTDSNAKLPDERVRPLALLGTDWTYDVERYAELLFRATETLLEPLGLKRGELKRRLKVAR